MIVDTGVPRNTKVLVEGVAQRKEADPEKYNPLIDKIGEVSKKIETSLENIKELQKNVVENQELL